LGIDLEVERSAIVDGYWKVYEDKAGWGEGSGYPGQIGNQVIFAHARKGLFLPLQSIKVGENIYVLTDTSWFVYEVYERKEVNPNQTEVIEPTDEEILTLYTCSGYEDSNRLIVKARPI
jgi:sortase A